MESAKRFGLWIAALLFTLACGAIDLFRSLPAATPTSPLAAPTLTESPIPTITVLPPTSASLSVPAWVTDFSNPILATVAAQQPDFSDQFSPYNQGWFIPNPENSRRPLYAHVRDRALFLELPEGGIKEDLTVYNPKLLYLDFVLSFDFKFGKTEPGDMLRFQFSHRDEIVAIDLSRNESWTYFWNLHNNVQSSSGAYDYFSPEFLNVTVIMQGSQCAVYLNRDPVDYLRDCRGELSGKLTSLTITFHLLGNGRPATVILDNVKLWNLDAPE